VTSRNASTADRLEAGRLLRQEGCDGTDALTKSLKLARTVFLRPHTLHYSLQTTCDSLPVWLTLPVTGPLKRNCTKFYESEDILNLPVYPEGNRFDHGHVAC
jgi:hypothetical protein